MVGRNEASSPGCEHSWMGQHQSFIMEGMTYRMLLPLVALAWTWAGAEAQTRSATHTFRVETVAAGLINPWSIAFLPDGEILVTERPGRLRIIRKGALDPRPIAGVPSVVAIGQGGLLDVVLHPRFADRK